MKYTLNKSKLFTSLLFITLFFTSCNSFFKGAMKDNGKQFPPDFGKTTTTILVVQAGRNSYDKYLIRNWKTYYSGDYVFVKREDLNQKMYEDIKKYRYIFDDEENSHTSRNISTGRNQTVTGVSFYLMDRQDGKHYSINVESGLWSKLMKAYLQKLDEIRKKNSSN